MKFARNATLGLAMAAACVLVGCGEGTDVAPPSDSEVESAQAASKSLHEMGPPPAAPGDQGKKGRRR